MSDHETNADDQSSTLEAAAENLIDFAGMPWESPAQGLRVKQVCRGDCRIRLLEFSEEFVEADWCRAGHIGYVIDGILDIDFSCQLVRFRAGDGFVIPSIESSKHKASVPCGRATLFVVENV